MQENDAVEGAQVLGRIEDLMEEERRLLSQGEAEHGLDREASARLAEVKAALDRCWFLTHERQLRGARRDPDKVSVQDAETVRGVGD
jgi:hypothetical protein